MRAAELLAKLQAIAWEVTDKKIAPLEGRDLQLRAIEEYGELRRLELGKEAESESVAVAPQVEPSKIALLEDSILRLKWILEAREVREAAKGYAIDFVLEHAAKALTARYDNINRPEPSSPSVAQELHTELVHIAADVTRGKYLLNLEGCKTIRHVLHRQATQEDNLRLALVERLKKLLKRLDTALKVSRD